MKLIFGILTLTLTGFSQDVPRPAGTSLREVIVSVRDERGQAVPGLTEKDFRVEQDGTPQSIVRFSQNTQTPVSIGMLIDSRNSMLPTKSLDKEVGAMRIVVQSLAKPGDEFSLMRFDDSFRLIDSFKIAQDQMDHSLSQLYVRDLTKYSPGPEMNLIVALRRALTEMKRSQYRERALVVATEAYYKENDLESILQEVRSSEIPIFVIGFTGMSVGVMGPVGPKMTAQAGERMAVTKEKTIEDILTRLAEESGGSSEMFVLDQTNAVNRLLAFSDEIEVRLRGQYRLGFYLKNSDSPSLNSIRVKSGFPNYSVHYRLLASN